MKTCAYILISLLFINENCVSGQKHLQNPDETQETTTERVMLELSSTIISEKTLENATWQITEEVTPATALELKEETENSSSERVPPETLNLANKPLVQIVLKDDINLNNNQDETGDSGIISIGYLIKVPPKSYPSELDQIILNDVQKTHEEKSLTTKNVSESLVEKDCPNDIVTDGISIKAVSSLELNSIKDTNFIGPELDKQELSRDISINSTDSFVEGNVTTIVKLAIHPKPLNSLELNRNIDISQTELILKSLKPLPEKPENHNTDPLANSGEFFVEKYSKNEYKINTKSPNSYNGEQNFDTLQSELVRIVLKDIRNLSNSTEEQKNFVKSSIKENLITTTTIPPITPTYATTISVAPTSTTNCPSVNELTLKPLRSSEDSRNLNITETEASGIVLREFSTLNSKQNGKEDNSSESLVEVDATTTSTIISTTPSFDTNATTSSTSDTWFAIESKLFTQPSNSFETARNSNVTETEKFQTVLKDNLSLTNEMEKLEKDENSLESFSDDAMSPGKEVSMKPLISLEEYAVKQMDFILDHLLLEIQQFVTKVLQATVNSVFPRDNLKRYAEGLNRVLNPDNVRLYSDEVIEDVKIASQDEIYEEIVKKLNFLKSKPSKYLQKYIPQEWINNFVNKRAELATWLDKAAEQMHKEFNSYIKEEEDHIKYQYFSETFDDISRATEIHHKLALLVDLVKIIQNKKQITFMDLYMQT